MIRRDFFVDFRGVLKRSSQNNSFITLFKAAAVFFLNWVKDENHSERDIDRDYIIIDFMRKHIVKKVASFHQLQNTYFMLKAKELVMQGKAYQYINDIIYI